MHKPSGSAVPDRNMPRTSVIPCHTDIVQLPHHGSRKNIDPEIIKRFNNPEYIISCPPDGESEGHPSRRLINKILEIKPNARFFMTKKSNFVFKENVEVKNLTTQSPATSSSRMDGK